MGKMYLTADYHLGHGNIIKYCKRPFKNVEEMNEAIIQNHNQRVTDDDLFIHNGDFNFRNSAGGKKGEGVVQKASYFKSRLNGQKIFILGNHERNNGNKTPIERLYLKYGGYRICVVHDPAHYDKTCMLNFVGHVHNTFKFKKLDENCYAINVGVDLWNFKPITFEEIMKEFMKWKKNETKTNPDANLQNGEKKKLRPKKMGETES